MILARCVASIIFLLGITGCSSSPEKPQNLVSEDTYTAMLVELQLVRSYGENAKVDSTEIDSLTAEVYNKYDVSTQQFQQSHGYYQHFPKKQKVRVENAIEQLKMELVTRSDTTDSTNVTPDSLELKRVN
jgi:hypothetical protein